MNAFLFFGSAFHCVLPVFLATSTDMFCGASQAQKLLHEVANCQTAAVSPASAILPASRAVPADVDSEVPMHFARVQILRGSEDEMMALLAGMEDEKLSALRDQIAKTSVAFDSALPDATVEKLMEQAKQRGIRRMSAPRMTCLEGSKGEVAMGVEPSKRLDPARKPTRLPEGQTELPVHAFFSLRLGPYRTSALTGSRLVVDVQLEIMHWREMVPEGGRPLDPVQTDPQLQDFETRRASLGFFPEPDSYCCVMMPNRSSFPFEPVVIEPGDPADGATTDGWKEKSLTLVLIRFND